MSDTLELLNLPNAEAQKIMVQDALIPGVDVDDLTMDMFRGQGSGVRFRISVPEQTQSLPGWVYSGQVDFLYRRMNLEEFFSSVDLRFAMTYPTSTQALATLLSQIFQVRFDPEDYINEVINPPGGILQYRFKAGLYSQRWIGEVSIQLTLAS